MRTGSTEELIESLVVELRRGTLVLSVLSQLERPEYGYSLVQKLEEKDAVIEPGTLYPLLRRLEKQNLLVSRWDTSENRPRKYYELSEEGKEVYERLKEEWKGLSKQLEVLTGGGNDGTD
ncbi:PadR family transcriptional regulator [Methanomassiliicoccus luminyensis]|jgi:PadR family transcriptional regulator PadR|uniref:PadR family transcriptional regulator n=1 Tax=Methanomassiliicoccus luminyensis TaxID=1080712 RepID=UPI000371DA5F|nr:PadR family transcriptional regulator [Methanomassiliicoccus luminyensis]